VGVGMTEIHELLSPSAEFEEGAPVTEWPAIAALRLLSGLEEVARASLAYRAPALSGRPPVPTTAELTREQRLWSTRSKAYRPALGDPSVIEALLKFKDQAPPIEMPPAPIMAPPQKHRPAGRAAIEPARFPQLAARDLEPCFPLAPNSKLLRPRT